MAAIEVAGGEVRKAGVCDAGSADPHGLGGDDAEGQRAVASLRSTFAVDAHSAASASELMGRPYAQTNRPPVTSTQPACDVTVTSCRPAPQVTCFAELCPPEARRKLRAWRHQLRRCVRCARQGRYTLAWLTEITVSRYTGSGLTYNLHAEDVMAV